MSTTYSQIPFAEPPWLTGVPSPMYSESHYKWQNTCRDFIEPRFGQNGLQWQKDGVAPDTIFSEFAEAGFLVPNLPALLPIEHLKAAGIHQLPGGLKLEDFDCLHYLIYISEIYHCGLWGPASIVIPGIAFGTPPIINYGSAALQKKVLPDLLRGQKRTCIAVTEPGAGSDVANIETTAEKVQDGKFYKVNGAKKWISNGIWADYATTAVRTGAKGAGGISLLLVPLKNMSGVKCRTMDISIGKMSGTTYIEFDDVLVDSSNLIGVEGEGLKYILTNFNHERLSMAISTTVQARKALSVAFEYTVRRKAFGMRVIDQPVVRHRIAKAGSELESQWAWVESLAYAMKMLEKSKADKLLAGQIALAKVRGAKVLQKCVSHAQLLLGGNSVTRTGQGEMIEMISCEVGLSRIPGGSEDPLMDFSTRQMLRRYEESIKHDDKRRSVAKL